MPAPGGDTDAGFYPLSAGTKSEYRNARTLRFTTYDGQQVHPPIEFRAVSTRTIIGQEEIAGVPWWVEEERILVEGHTDTVVMWRRYREDVTGLYQADLRTSLPPGKVGGGVAAFRQLAYPRRVGTAWPIRDGLLAGTGMIETAAPVTTPLGELTVLTVRYVVPDQGPRDRRVVRYSACGVIGNERHSEIEVIDGQTGQLITMTDTETTEIVSVHPPCTRLGARWEEGELTAHAHASWSPLEAGSPPAHPGSGM